MCGGVPVFTDTIICGVFFLVEMFHRATKGIVAPVTQGKIKYRKDFQLSFCKLLVK